jgi:hypothetical protein
MCAGKTQRRPCLDLATILYGQFPNVTFMTPFSSGSLMVRQISITQQAPLAWLVQNLVFEPSTTAHVYGQTRTDFTVQSQTTVRQNGPPGRFDTDA